MYIIPQYMTSPTVDLPILDGPKWISHIEVSRDPEIAAKVAERNQMKGIVADRLGRIAFVEGKKRGRNPCHPPHNRNWNDGYDSERAETLEACREG